MKKQFDIRFAVLFIILALVGIWRVVSTSVDTSMNFSPIGAMALFAGTYFINRSKALITPLIILLVSDVCLMQLVFPEYRSGLLYSGWYWTYGSFFLIVLVGEWLKSGSVFKSVFVGGLLAGGLHFVITNFGVWIGGSTNVTTGLPFTKDWAGLVECYTLAIPFFRNMLLGNWIFGAILFGAFELAQRKFPALKISLSNS